MDRSRTVEVEPALGGGDDEGDCRRRRGGLASDGDRSLVMALTS